MDWEDFDAIFDYALSLWPIEVELSTKRTTDGGRIGFAAWDYEDSIDSPYLARKDSKHIVRLMLWAMFCALPRDRFDGLFPTALIDRNDTKKKFENDLLSDLMNHDTDPEEILYFLKNLKK